MTDQGASFSPADPAGSPTGGYFGQRRDHELRLGADAGLDFNITPNLKLELG